VRTEEVHDKRHGGDASVCEPRLLKYNCWSVIFDKEVCNSASLIHNINRTVDSNQLTSPFEMVHPTLKGPPCHNPRCSFFDLNLRICACAVLIHFKASVNSNRFLHVPPLLSSIYEGLDEDV
jgi:hypothetical protein